MDLGVALRHRMTTDPPTAYRADDGSVLVPILLSTGVEKDAVSEMSTAGMQLLKAAEMPAET